MRRVFYGASGQLPIGIIYAAAKKSWPSAAIKAYARPVPLSLRDYFGGTPNLNLQGAECYVYPDDDGYSLLYLNEGGGAALLNGQPLHVCTQAADWMGARGAAVVIWHGEYEDMPLASGRAVQ
jgi:hypothetical protein